LGVPPTSTVEELKAAHSKLALRYHPDTASIAAAAGSSSQDANVIDSAERFHEVSEAWSVLSKSETRSRYDSFRQRQGFSINGVGGVVIPGTPTAIPNNYDTQRANFASVKHAASSNWRELTDKYKTEKWQNMPLVERKLLRQRHVGSLGGSFLFVAIPACVIGASAYYYWSSHFGPEASKTRKKLPTAK
jgi:curved DNA-binding protein CbpA